MNSWHIKTLKEYGFTLIELLVTVAIVGVLVSIAVPEFTEYRQRAYDAVALNALQNVLRSQEAYAVDNAGAYGSCSGVSACESIFPDIGEFNDSISIGTIGGSAAFNAQACSSKGSPNTAPAVNGSIKVFFYQSGSGMGGAVPGTITSESYSTSLPICG